MKVSLGLLFTVSLATLLTACTPSSNSDDSGQFTTTSVEQPGPNNNGFGPQPNVQIKAKPNHMKYANSITTDQATALDETISSLYAVPVKSSLTASYLQQMMGLSDMSAKSLQQWLETRVTYIVDQDFDIQSNLSFEATTTQFPYADQIPDPIKNEKTSTTGTSDSAQAQVVMLNVGSAAYYYGKVASKIADVNIPGAGVASMKSPRTGLLQVGPGLFNFLGDTKGTQLQNVMSDIFRAGTLFHEARHSDGHGLTLGFFHDNCPAGSDYAGLPACDAATNGPYTIGSQMMKNLMDSCGDSCTPLTIKVLQILYADQADRTLTDTDLPNLSPGAKAGTAWDDAPESVN